MEIVQTITTMAERTVVYKHDGKQGSITRPSNVSFEEIYKLLNEKFSEKKASPLAVDPPVSEHPEPVEAVTPKVEKPVVKKHSKRKA